MTEMSEIPEDDDVSELGGLAAPPETDDGLQDTFEADDGTDL